MDDCLLQTHGDISDLLFISDSDFAFYVVFEGLGWNLTMLREQQTSTIDAFIASGKLAALATVGSRGKNYGITDRMNKH
jgi:hypothetical protein